MHNFIKYLTVITLGYTSYTIAKSVYDSHIKHSIAKAASNTPSDAGASIMSNPLLIPQQTPASEYALGFDPFKTPGV